jgi:hypothetical protein
MNHINNAGNTIHFITGNHLVFKHIVKLEKIKGYNPVNMLKGYPILGYKKRQTPQH